jgi:hypothetical protein
MAIFEQHTAALVKPPENTVIQGGFPGDPVYQDTLTIGMLAPLFLEWTRYEMRRAPATVQRYGEALQWVIRDIGDQPVTGLHLGHLLTLRRKMETRGCREARIAAILHALRAFLKFCREVVRVPTLSSREIVAEQIERSHRREVVHLRESVEQVLTAPAVAGLVEVELHAFAAQVHDISGTRAVDVGKTDAAPVEQFRRLEPGCVAHGDLGAKASIAEVGPVADLAVADPHEIGQPIPGQIGEVDGLGAIGNDELGTFLFVQGLAHPLGRTEARLGE